MQYENITSATFSQQELAPDTQPAINALANYLALVSSCLIIMLAYRLVTYLWIESWNLPQAGGSLFIYALRWDAKLLATWGLLIIFIAAPWLLIRKTAEFGARLITSLNALFLVFICISSHILTIYWDAVGHPFDSFMFGLVHDETEEILSIIWDDYNPLRNLILMCVVVALAFWGQQKKQGIFASFLQKNYSKPARIVFFIALFIGLALAARGSVSLFPLNKKTTHFSRDNFINELAINAPNHFYYALKEKDTNELDSDPLLRLQKAGYHSIEDAADKLLFKGASTLQGVPLIRQSRAEFVGPKPNFMLIMMESWSSHILFANSETNDLLGSFKDQQHQGALFTQFLSTRLGTSRFIESTLLNTSLLDISISPAQKMRLRYSNLQLLKQEGYKIYFVSGGARSWLNHDSFWRKQGASEYWDMSDIMKRYKVKKHSDWGVHDEYTLAFAQEKASQLARQGEPFFMFVITTSNHPPHSTPSHYPVPEFDSKVFPEEHLIKPDKINQQLATFRYSTDQLGLFLAEMKKNQLDKTTVIAATGDHILRGFYQYSSDTEQALAGAVPFYIQAPDYLMHGRQWNTQLPASHRDIFPTFFELAIPGAQYLKTGFNLLDPDEFHGAWHEHNIWLIPGEVSFADDELSYAITNGLHVTDVRTMSDTMHGYRHHTKALEALLEWQLRQEFLQYRNKPKTLNKTN